MKRFLSSVLITLLMAKTAWASADLVKERAKRQRDINNEQQGVVPPAPNAPAQPGGYAAPATPSGPQGISSAQQKLVDRLETDFTAIKPATTATPEQKQSLQNDLATLAKGANKPSSPALAKLAANLSAALAEKTIAAPQLTQLAKNLNIIMNCTIMNSARAQTFVAEAQTVLKTAGVSAPNVQAVGSDLKAIVAELQKSKPKLYQ